MSESINEGRHQVKRKYGAYPRIRINEKGAAVRDTIIKYVGKNYVREEDLHNYLIRLEEDRDGHSKINKARWFKRNTKFFNTFEKNNERYYSLSRYGQRVLELIKQDKKTPPAVNESMLRNIPSLSEFMSVEESVNEGPDYDEASFQMDKIFGDDQESIEAFQDIEDNGDWKDMVDYIDMYANTDELQRYGIRTTAHVKKFAKHIMRESVKESTLNEKWNVEVEEPFSDKKEKGAQVKYAFRSAPIKIVNAEGFITEDETEVTLKFSNGDELEYFYTYNPKGMPERGLSIRTKFMGSGYSVPYAKIERYMGNTGTIIGDLGNVYTDFQMGILKLGQPHNN